ncbi:Protein phosphatase 2C [Chitinophaga jiangningensis]|uniref:Protein phosphatase 2C n=2 Tax=Chitinophaga jiangningensis TaxID=1419482 RepID=A0A1M6YIL1_9BACT|nr:Protein phosphatase 2C [Chitinophaga jiangningensis]
MDGCSMGIDSYFAATLTGKILKQVAKELAYKEFADQTPVAPAVLMKLILQQLFEKLKSIRNQLDLKRNELLNTLILAVIDTANKSGEFICIGDGVIHIDGTLYDYDQQNKPDYIGYHLTEDFENWYANQQQRLSVSVINDFSLVTDGIYTFSKFDHKAYDPPGNIAEYLLVDGDANSVENMLHQKMIEIKNNWGLAPTDDLAIVRCIL